MKPLIVPWFQNSFLGIVWLFVGLFRRHVPETRDGVLHRGQDERVEYASSVRMIFRVSAVDRMLSWSGERRGVST